jgi:Zn-dependent protease with chaperone function
MTGQLSLAPLFFMWVMLVTVGSPLILDGRKTLQQLPRLGLIVWFTLLLSAFLAGLALVELIFLFVLELWMQLSTTSAGLQNLAVVIFQSLAPWVLLAGGSGLLVLINARLEPLGQQAAQMRAALDTELPADFTFEGVPVSVVRVDFPLAFVARVAGKNRIVISSGAKALLTDDELNVVLWHEIGHIWGGHNWLRRIAYLVKAITPRLPVSQAMVANVELLCELEADGFAAKRAPAKALSSAREKFVF